MENTALNGTTNATKDHEDWKKKKGYGPVLVTVSLALLLSLYAGGYLGSGTHLRHDEMKTTNAAVSSSSTSLVGSGTAALDWKTLTMETDGFSSGVPVPHSSGKGATANSSGQPGSSCGVTSDCVTPPGLDHGVCRYGRCQSGGTGSSCGATSDCVTPPGLEHPVCRNGQCQSGGTASSCGATSDCVVPQGLEHPVCRDGFCRSGASGSICGATSDCVVPPGLEHAVCRDGRCQSGTSGSSCGATSDCVVPPGLEHAVCRGNEEGGHSSDGQCQRGVCFDYCGQSNDCIEGLYCKTFGFKGYQCYNVTCLS